ncbi:MAG TPA: uL15m family ribosomal protein, partial [Allocoleopsis sp.]
SGVAKKEGSKYVIDLKAMKCNKLLGSGTPTKVYEITTDFATSSAVEKVKAAKGTVTVKYASEKSE